MTPTCQNHKKDIAGFDGVYCVNAIGIVISTPRRNKPKGGIMKAKITKCGYLEVCLTKNRKKYHKLVHSLVAAAYIPNPQNKPQVNHKNGNKKDNRVENLEWATASENQKHAFANNLIVQKKGEKSCRSKLTELQAIDILHSKESLVQLSKKYWVSVSSVFNIKNKITWKHLN